MKDPADRHTHDLDMRPQLEEIRRAKELEGQFCSGCDKPAYCGTPTYWFCRACWLYFQGSVV